MHLGLSFTVALLALGAPAKDAPAAPHIVVAEGEQFQPLDAKGWKRTQQDDSYASHTYGGMWVTHGGLLGAPADSVDSVAKQTVQVPAAGRYRVWSKYQAPPYFNYLHKVEVQQNGKTVFTHVYGKKGTERLWSFSGSSNELWWPWGVDHDAAEAPKEMIELAAGPAEIRLVTVANPKPAGDRMVDFVLLTTNPGDEYSGFKPYNVGSPFCREALAAGRLYLRFQNTTATPAQLSVTRYGHFQPDYGSATGKFPETPVAAGQWSEWVNIGPFCRLVHNEGLTLSLAGAASIPVQFARDPAGKELVGDLKVADRDNVLVPLEITWQADARVRASKDYAADIVAQCKTKWRTANGGKKPKEILFYGAFSGPKDDWVLDLKDALGYNTGLPDKYDHVRRDGLHAHAHSLAEIEKFASTLADKDRFRVLSFGDEIHLGRINFKDVKLQEKFRAWVKAKGLTAQDLGVAPEKAELMDTGNPRLVWYSNLFNEEERFAHYRDMTRLAKEKIGAHVLTGANYSPHTLALCYGPIYQWIDIFKHNGMSMFWGEDYIFSVPEVPQMLSWMLAQMRCGTKYNNQPIHLYVMPHSPGQEAGFLRRNMLLSVAYGAKHIDSFWVAPQERFTENYVAWNYPETFRTIHEAIYDIAEAEPYLVGGKQRPAQVAVILSKATDFNESRLMIDKAQDPFAAQCRNAPEKLNQIICRKEQQMLYLALRQHQIDVDLITEDDIVETDALKQYKAVYFAGEWVDNRILPKLDAWVQAGGMLYADAGCGHLNQFNEPEPGMLKLLGVKDAKLQKNLVIMRTLLELPLAEPIDTIRLVGEGQIPAVGMKQQLVLDSAKALGHWGDGSVAVAVRHHGRGRTYAVGTLAGTTYMKSGLRVQPWARGGRHTLYNPFDRSPNDFLTMLPFHLNINEPTAPVRCSNSLVEAVVRDGEKGSVITLVNWTNGPVKNLNVKIRLPARPKEIRSVSGAKIVNNSDGVDELSFILDLKEADFILLPK